MSKTSESQLSDEFKKDIKEKKKNNNFLGTVLAFLALSLVFGTVGVAGYQILVRPENIESKSASEKIESRPEEKPQTTPETPAATTTTPPAETPTPASTPATTTTTTPKEYTVASGDVLGSIASKFDTTVAKLKELNGITDENSLQIGQVIKISN